MWFLNFCHSNSCLFWLIHMKILPRIRESCPIKKEYLHNVIFKLLSHKSSLILTNTMEILPRISDSCITKNEFSCLPTKNTNSHYILLNTTIIPPCNGKISQIFFCEGWKYILYLILQKFLRWQMSCILFQYFSCFIESSKKRGNMSLNLFCMK